MKRAPEWLVLGMLLGGAGRAAAQAPDLGKAVVESYPTNLTVITDAAEEAVNELLVGFNAPPGATLHVTHEATHKGNWFLEDLILARLAGMGYSATLKDADSLAVRADSTAGPVLPAAPPPVGTERAAAPYAFRYRVVEFSLDYPESFRKSPLGARHVQRHAVVKLSARLVEGGEERIRWIGQGESDRLDVVPASKLGLLEGDTFPVEVPALKTRSLGAYVEPVLVTGIVAGLIYLFYTNQD